jgi:hypothetical protein
LEFTCFFPYRALTYQELSEHVLLSHRLHTRWEFVFMKHFRQTVNSILIFIWFKFKPAIHMFEWSKIVNSLANNIGTNTFMIHFEKNILTLLIVM